MISKEELIKMAKQYQEKAERAFMNYQETGMSRYDSQYKKADDLASALRAAANAADEHSTLGSLRAEVVWWAGKADALLAEDAPREKLTALLESIISYASAVCHYRRREE